MKSIAFESIIKNIDNVWTRKYVKDWGDKHLLYVEGPFDCLTPVDCHSILTELASRKILKRHHIYLLINPYLQVLNLSDFRDQKDGSKLKLILDLTLTRCRNLKKMVVRSSQDFSSTFMPYLEIFNNITDLELPNTKLNNFDVSLIGIHAPNLRLLNLMDTGFSGSGLKTLFFPVDHEGNADQAYGQCQKIEILDIRGTDISPETAANVYSHRQNKWKLFRIDNTFKVLMNCFQSEENSVEAFKTDHVTFGPLESDDFQLDAYIQAALVLSPNASDLYLYDINANDKSIGDTLSMIQHFSKVTHLTLDVRQEFHSFLRPPPQDQIFDIGITPILKNHGENLTFIMLTFVRHLDLDLLVCHCSRLEQLRLQFNVYSNALSNLKIDADWPLKNLVIQCCPPQPSNNDSFCPSPAIFSKILAHASNLESLVVSYCKTFNDKVVLDASQFNNFTKLGAFIVTNCNYITMSALEDSMLMKHEAPLDNVVLFGCDLITIDDYNRYTKYLKSNGYKVNVQWQ